MYESEANLITASAAEIPPHVLRRFAETRKAVTKRTLLPWGEHCDECVWPSCYSTCDLYVPRPDGRCRRFLEGIVRVDCPQALDGYLLKITFKRWAKLWAPTNLRLYSLSDADKAERGDLRAAKYIQLIPLDALRSAAAVKRYSWKKRIAGYNRAPGEKPDSLLIECYNPNPEIVRVTLTIRREGAVIPFQSLLDMDPGFNRFRISAADIDRLLTLSGGVSVELMPNDVFEPVTLYFGALDFVTHTPAASLPERTRQPEMKETAEILGSNGSGGENPLFSPACKCVVWDLDNTLWEGTLLEDGRDGIRLKPRVKEVLDLLDQRGILLSIASKNNPEDTINVLRELGLADYFIYPQISWRPKSEGVRRIAKMLNIGIDSLLFVDDLPFEREEVRAACPAIKLLDAAEYLEIASRPDCQAVITDESRRRRLLYRDQEQRDCAQKQYGGDYLSFLRLCRLKMLIRKMTPENIDRVYELAQRTNQMNFSGNRYSRDELRDIVGRADRHTYVVDCEDRFGNYGTVGFCIVNSTEHRMLDLMFSCRIQGKRVEHAFLSHIVKQYRHLASTTFSVDYRRTGKNAASGAVFTDLGFQVTGEHAGITRLELSPESAIREDAIIEVEDHTLYLSRNPR